MLLKFHIAKLLVSEELEKSHHPANIQAHHTSDLHCHEGYDSSYALLTINAYATVNTISRVILRLLLIQSIPSSRSPPLNLRLFT